jgi:predicted regulator of Ras-like GTPase activity (Roadblock/LC7/MglB family)
MQALLGPLVSVPGVIGTMLCSPEGELLAHAFPPTFEPGRLRDAAAALAGRGRALEAALGKVGTVDLRYAGGRVVVKGMAGARLLFFCAPSINLELLTMSVSGAVAELERAVRGARPAAPAAPAEGATSTGAPAGPAPAAAAGGRLWETVQRVNALIERSGEEPFKLRGKIALKAGFSLDLIDADTPDDPSRLQKLRAAASAVLGQPV